MAGYNTHSDEDKNQMLEVIGADSVDALFSSIPRSILLNRKLHLSGPLAEWEVEADIYRLACQNATSRSHKTYIGGGFYDHHIPAAVDAIASRGEFLTSYTPYQPEMSPGLLQSLYEYQELMSKLTGHEVVNSSCYDGATALADAAWVCCLATVRDSHKILIGRSLWPQYIEVLETYAWGRGIEIVYADPDPKTGRIEVEALASMLKEHKPSGFLFQSPNAFGVIERVGDIADCCKEYGALSVISYNPISTGLLQPPGKMGVDIVTGEGQPLGIPMRVGGSSLGIFSTRKELRKYVPGRLVGKVTDIKGRLAYSLVYEDREQHVAREKATSNICSNQALNAIRAGVYLALLGEEGLTSVSVLNAGMARALWKRLLDIEGIGAVFDSPFFNEFVISLPCPVERVIEYMQSHGIFCGIDVSDRVSSANALLVAVTETKSEDDIDHYVTSMKEAISL